MGQLYYNPETKVIFESDDAQADSIQKIDASEIENLVHIGAVVDQSVTQNIAQPAVDLATDTAGLPSVTVPAVQDPTTSTSGGQAPVTSGTDTGSTQATAPVTKTDSQSSDASSETDVTPSSSDATNKAAAEQAEADAGVDTTKDVGAVTLTPDNLGSVTGQPVTPDGTPVVEAQPEAVTVKGPEYPENSPVVAASDDAANDTAGFDDLDHKGVLERLLGELEGIAAMGKAEIQAVLVRARNAVEKL